MVEVSILLLTKNGRRDLELVLPQLSTQECAFAYEVIAIDSGSTDGTVELLREFPVRLHQIPPEDFHHARTRNLAARLAQGKIIVFLSQDAIPCSSNWLTTLISAFDDPKVGAVYGRQLPKPDSSLERRHLLDAVYGEDQIVKDPKKLNRIGYRFYHFSDVNAAIRRGVWKQVPFPEDLKVFEDLGIAKLILDQGWRIIYEPKAAVLHSHRHTTAGLFKRYFDIGYTLRLLKIWDAPGIKASMLRDCLKLLSNKLRKTNKARSRSAGEGICQDLAKSAGLLLGLNQQHLPLALKRKLSAYRVFG